MKTIKRNLLASVFGLLFLVGSIHALDFTMPAKPFKARPVVYRFTPREVTEAMKEMIQRKYPNADLSSTNITLTWHGEGIAGRELPEYVGQRIDWVWSSTYEGGKCTNCVELKVMVMPHFETPQEMNIPSGWIWNNYPHSYFQYVGITNR